jgi:hypothetical protein
MKEDLQDIGDLYKNEFEDAPFEFDKTNWVTIQPQLDKMQFFRFSFFKFNIYYVSVIAFSFLFSAYTMIRFVSGNKKQTTENISVITSDSVVIDSEDTIVYRTEQRSFSGSNSAKRKPSDYINIIKPDHYIDESIEKTDDSLLITKINTNQTEIKETPVATKKSDGTDEKTDILYITKQDTIVVVDTINSATARRRMKKNKMYGK